MNWVMPSVVTQQTGLKANQLKSMVQRKKLTRDIHYTVIDGKRMYNLPAIEHWFHAQVPLANEISKPVNQARRMQL